MRIISPLVFVLLLCALPFSLANEPSARTTQTFLKPFYRSSMNNNQEYSYYVSLVSPDKISSVSSAIISFDIYLNPSVLFILLVNNKSCSTPNFSVSTTYAGAGQARVSFDCSNIITQAGTYAVSLKPVGANTGAIIGWLDATYSNYPKGELNIRGTEYVAGDQATIFTQLLDSNRLPINNGSCYLDVFYPLMNGSHPYTIRDAPMIPSIGSDGLYYYDLVAPNQSGVYMLSARCAYAYNWVWFFAPEELLRKPLNYTLLGSWSGDTLALNSPSDLTFYNCNVAALGAGCLANFTFNISSLSSAIYNITTMSLYYAGQIKGSLSNPWNLFLSYWNGTRFVSLSNSMIMTHQGDAPLGTDQYVTNTVPLAAIQNNSTIIILLNLTGGSGTGTTLWNNWLSIAVLLNTGTVQDVKGASEMHVSAQQMNLLNSINKSVSSLNTTCSVNQNITFNLTCNNSIVFNGSVNFTGNFSCQPFNYSFVNATCSGFFAQNGGEIMWVILFLIALCVIIAEVAKTNWLRLASVLSLMTLCTTYYKEDWFYIAMLITSFYALYALVMFFVARDQWSGKR